MLFTLHVHRFQHNLAISICLLRFKISYLNSFFQLLMFRYYLFFFFPILRNPFLFIQITCPKNVKEQHKSCVELKANKKHTNQKKNTDLEQSSEKSLFEHLNPDPRCQQKFKKSSRYQTKRLDNSLLLLQFFEQRLQ